MNKVVLLVVGFLVLFMFIAALVTTGSVLIGISLDVPGRYHRTAGICTVESGMSFNLFLSLLYHDLFIFFISSHLISSHLISSHLILFCLLFLAFFLANIITAKHLLRFRGKYGSTYKPLWAVTVFASDDVYMTNSLFWSASSVEDDISSTYLSSWYTLPSEEEKKDDESQ